MGILQRIRDFVTPERSNAVEFSPELIAAIRGNGGGEVSYEKAIQVSTVLRCAAIGAEDLCSIPWKLYRDGPNGKKEEDEDHPLFDLITYGPNDWQTSFEFRKTIGLHLMLCGNAYVWMNKIPRRGGGFKVAEMIIYEPGRVRVCQKDDWTVEYRLYGRDGSEIVTTNENVWHLKGHSWDSYKGLSALMYAREAIGLAGDIEADQRSMHKNFARPAGVLTVQQDLDATQFERFRKLIDKQVETRLRHSLPLVLDKNIEWKAMAHKPVDMQAVENRGFQVEEICRNMGILPIMVGYTGDKGSTYASAEQMFIHHYRSFTRVLHRNFMESADRWLLSPRDRKAGYYNHLVDQALLRGDAKARGEFYRMLWMIGAISGNEIRGLEDMDRLDGLDRPFVPLANAPLGEDGLPIIVENDTTDNNFRSDEEIADRIKNLNPMMRQRAIAVLKMLSKPGEGDDL